MRAYGFVAAALIMFAAGSGVAGAVTVTDAAGRTVSVEDASRIASIGGSVTEILYALGVEQRIVAVDVTSTFPTRVHTKPSLGYMRTLSPEGVLSVDPRVIIAIEGSGPREAIDVLEKAAVPFVLIPEARDTAGVARKIRMVAEVVGEREKGEALASAVLADLDALAKLRERITTRRKAVFVLAMGSGAPLVGGTGTGADAIFALAGVDNALAGIDGYKPASAEAVLAAPPDAVVMMAERAADQSGQATLSLPLFAGSPAARDGRLVSLPGSYLLDFGPRVAHAARDLAAAIYPELALPKLPARPWTDDAAATD